MVRRIDKEMQPSAKRIFLRGVILPLASGGESPTTKEKPFCRALCIEIPIDSTDSTAAKYGETKREVEEESFLVNVMNSDAMI